MATIGFIGLGNMGLPMAGNLVKAGHVVTVFDLSSSRVEAAVAMGAKAASDAAACGAGADMVITMLPQGAHTLAIYEESGVLETAPRGCLFVDCSSIDVASANRAHELAAAPGMRSLDAPVSGGITGAKNATLTLMVGGDADTLAAAHPVLEAVSRLIVHCGGPGAGQMVKMCNQMMVATNMAVVAESFALAEHFGIDPKILYDVVNNSSGQSFALTHYVPVPGLIETGRAEHDFAPGFTTALMLKDVNIFQKAAQDAGLPSPVGSCVARLYEASCADGRRELDYSSVIQHIRARKGSAS